MKQTLLTIAMLIATSTLMVEAQVIRETFDSNSMEWTEAPKGQRGSAIIDKGVMTLTSKKRDNMPTMYETHCYVPFNMERPFSITANVTIGQLDNDDNQTVGMIFNYKDFGNFYAFAFDEYNIKFTRYENGQEVGYIYQGMKWSDKRKAQQVWKLEYEGNELRFYVDDVPVFRVKHMDLKYTGVGFYATEKQKLIIDEVEFAQQ